MMDRNIPVKLIFTGMFCFVASCFSCDSKPYNDVQITEIKRLQSDDHQVDAVMVETGVDATTSTSEKIFIVKHGDKIKIVDLPSAVFVCDHFSGVDIKFAHFV